HFIDVLLTAITEPQGPVVAVLTLRADFYDRPMRYPKLSRLIESYHTPVLPMELHDLRAVIEEPAALSDVQLTFEGNLVGDLLFETQGQAGALPLLEFTLDQLFQRREGHWLTLQAYQQIGGVKGALAKHAESIYASLPTEEHRNLARTLFLRLIDPGITEQDTTRRRANLAELALPDAQQTQIMKEVADTFVSARLLTTNEIAGETTIEVSHEALIREWARLGTWLREARSDIVLQHTLSSDVSDWLQRSRPTDRLYRGTRLTEAQAWAERNTPSEREVAFLQASTAEYQRQEAEELNRRARELTLKRQAVQRLSLAAILSLLLIVSIVFALVTQGLLRQVSDQRLAIALAAQSHALAAQADYALSAGQIDKALLLSVKANQTDNNFNARDSLLNALEYSPHLITMLQENSAVNHVIFHPDGQVLIALGSLDNSAEVTFWDMKTRKGHTTYLDFRGVAGTISSWALSPNGQLVAGANDQGLWLWETQKGAKIARLETTQPAQSPTTSQSYTPPASTPITFSPDSTMLASGRCTQYDSAKTNCVQSQLLLWNMTTQLPTSQRLGNIPALITHLAFSSDGKTLYSSTQTSGSANPGGGLQLWDVASGTQLVQSFAGYSGGVADFVLSPDSKTLAASDGNANIYLWDVQSQKALEPPLSMKGVRYLAFSPDSKTLAASSTPTNGIPSSTDYVVHLWNILASPPSDVPLLGHRMSSTNTITSLSFSPDGQTLASGDSDGAILVWNMGTDSSLKHEFPYTSRLSSATFSPNGKVIVVGDTTGKITFSDATTGQPLDALDATASPDTQESDTVDSGPLWVKSLAFSPDKRLLAAGRYDGMIFVWNAATKKPIANFHGEKQLINIAFNADSHTLAASYSNGSILLWDSIKGRILHQLRPPIQNSNGASSLAFSPDGKLLASGDNNALVFWDVATDKLIGQPLREHPSSITNVAFSPDGKMLASIDSNSNIQLWDVATKTPLLTTPLNNTDTSVIFEVPNQTGLVFSPDSTMLAAGGGQSVTVWDVGKRERFTHAFHPRGSSVLPAQVRGVTFSPDGQHLLVLSDTYTANYLATLWDINRGSWQRYACSIVNRNLALDEWSQSLEGEPYQKVCPAFPVDSSVTQDELTKAHADVQAGNRSDAQSVYAQAQREASQLDDPDLANNVCWWGSLDQFANTVLSSCERAITLNPYYGQYHDSRGVARALMEDRQGAIDDFNFFLQWAQGQESTPKLAHAIPERTGWIHALEAGKNPFDAQTLKALRVESGIDIA
ncbi:MAG: hypothetical protein JOZ18_03580, partial [Chloroflexi bacterium]|nr:hypothetical protein [Chloroflexota bacterium]